MEPDGVERKLAAILSADVAGYSRLMAADEVATVRRLAAYRDEIGLLVRQHRGRVVDSPGDNLLAEFPSALDAVRSAIEIQRVLAARNADVPPDRKMEFRIGVHLGDVMVEGERIYGDGVNVAARLEGLAEAGAVCISGTVYEQVRGKLSVGWEDLGEQTVKNIAHPVRAYRARMAPEEPAPTEPPGAPEWAAARRAGRPDVAVLVVPAVWVFYVAIVFEILFMISPFALYYYSVYGSPLNFLHLSPSTAWLTEFFLPHFSQTSSPVLNGLRGLGQLLILLGGAVFLLAFVQIYLAKGRRRGPVTGGLYLLSRHPQYFGLAIVGLGTLLVWPRFLVLVTYLTMLFLYGLLSRWEEQRCLQQFGESYRAYLERTGMFLPRRLLGKLPRLLPASGGNRLLAALALYAVLMATGVGLAHWLQDFSLSHVSAFYTDTSAVISPAILTEGELRRAVQVATTSPDVRRGLNAAGRAIQLLVYVLPVEWYFADLPMEVPADRRGHEEPADFDRRLYKVLFTRVRTHDPAATGEEIVKKAYGRDPIIVARVNLETAKVTGIETPPPHVRWGDIPTPLF